MSEFAHYVLFFHDMALGRIATMSMGAYIDDFSFLRRNVYYACNVKAF